MRFNGAQVSLEYLILTGFIVAAVLIPSFLILFGSTSKSVHDTVSTQNIADLGKGLINDAKQMYYLGIYSRKISVYEIPKNVESMFILKLNNGVQDYYYIGVYVDNGKESRIDTFNSDIPLTSDISDNVVIDNSLASLVKECSKLGYSCEFYSFTGSAIKPGQKRFKIETVLRDGIIQSSIIPVLN